MKTIFGKLFLVFLFWGIGLSMDTTDSSIHSVDSNSRNYALDGPEDSVNYEPKLGDFRKVLTDFETNHPFGKLIQEGSILVLGSPCEENGKIKESNSLSLDSLLRKNSEKKRYNFVNASIFGTQEDNFVVSINDLKQNTVKTLWIENQLEEVQYQLSTIVAEKIEDREVTKITNNVIKDIAKKYKISIEAAGEAIEWMKTEYSPDNLTHFVRTMWTKSEKTENPKFDGVTRKDHYYDELNVAIWKNIKVEKLNEYIQKLEREVSELQQNEDDNSETENDKQFAGIETPTVEQYVSKQEDLESEQGDLEYEQENLGSEQLKLQVKFEYQLKFVKRFIRGLREVNKEIMNEVLVHDNNPTFAELFISYEEFKQKLELEHKIVKLEHQIEEKVKERYTQTTNNHDLSKDIEEFIQYIEKLESDLDDQKHLLIVAKKMNIYLRLMKQKINDQIKNIKKQNKKRNTLMPKCLQKNKNVPENKSIFLKCLQKNKNEPENKI